MSKQLTAKNCVLLNTSGTPTAVNVLSTSSKVIVNPTATTIESNLYGNGQGGAAKTQTIADITKADFTVDIDAKFAGIAGTAPKCAELLKACGLKETITADTSVVYTPELTGTTGVVKSYVDGEVREITGVVGDFTMSAKVGEMLKYSFTLKGFTNLDPVSEANPAVTLDTNEYIVVSTITAITEAGSAIDATALDFKYGATVQESIATQTKENYIEDFKPTLDITAIKTKGNKDHWDDLAVNTIKEVKMVCGTESGKIMEFVASYCNPSNVSESDESGKMVFTKTHLCEANAGGDNFSITYK